MKNKKLKTVIFLSLLLLGLANTNAQSETTNVKNFDKVIVSPHISVNFIQGDSESVTIETCSVDKNKLNIEVDGKTLRIYLEGAKEVTKNEKYKKDGQKRTRSLYKGTVVTATVTYKNIDELSLRGEEKFSCKSPIVQDDFRLKIYGESEITINKVNLKKLRTTMYGESYIVIKEGNIGYQKFTGYGEAKINTLGLANKSTKITAYGEGSYRVNVSEELKVTAYGEATVAYKGNPEVNKGIVIGEATIQRISE
ncbi:head GIN domain-containing protein [Aureibaculum sp. 2210JD6-5]|uniref:head GIN domain-containing protein n=1 Tax=Aureibaculum sp. 2210JD6-5 TaxID=3103957 RepID=UPI002AACEE5F|nr:head GIN domain-containing protein [Aureibaculum sp. 2210JD6-5]MDY7393879.1 head GIN domain-containing protein [Aureibaculum sp. 2210JD6-5]